MGVYAVSAYRNDHGERIEKMFKTLVEQIRQALPDFGKHLAMDSKAIRGREEQERDAGRAPGYE